MNYKVYISLSRGDINYETNMKELEKIVPAKEEEHTNMQKEAQTVTQRYSNSKNLPINQYIGIQHIFIKSVV